MRVNFLAVNRDRLKLHDRIVNGRVKFHQPERACFIVTPDQAVRLDDRVRMPVRQLRTFLKGARAVFDERSMRNAWCPIWCSLCFCVWVGAFLQRVLVKCVVSPLRASQ